MGSTFGVIYVVLYLRSRYAASVAVVLLVVVVLVIAVVTII